MIKVQAHRGASGYAPENTLASFRLAVEMKADGIECDIHLSKDRKFVVCHDSTIDRTSDGKGRISDMTYDEIASHCFSLRHPSLPRQTAPTLEMMLDVVKDMDVINIEVKEFAEDETGALHAFYDILKKYGVIDRVIVSSFNVDLLGRLKKLHPDLYTAYLYCKGFSSEIYPVYPMEKVVETALDRGCGALHPSIYDIDKKLVDDAHAHGLKVNCWWANPRAQVEKAIDIGCDGIIMDFPDWCLKAVGR